MSDKIQVERIKKMEEILDEGTGIVLELEHAVDRYTAFADKIDELEQYYTGGQWRKDYEDDDAGRLPHNLKRGVLSEDAVYNFLALRDQVLERLKQ